MVNPVSKALVRLGVILVALLAPNYSFGDAAPANIITVFARTTTANGTVLPCECTLHLAPYLVGSPGKEIIAGKCELGKYAQATDNDRCARQCFITRLEQLGVLPSDAKAGPCEDLSKSAQIPLANPLSRREGRPRAS